MKKASITVLVALGIFAIFTSRPQKAHAQTDAVTMACGFECLYMCKDQGHSDIDKFEDCIINCQNWYCPN